MGKRIFIIDDEPDMLKIAVDLLEDDGYIVQSDIHPVSGLKKIQTSPPDLVLLDIRLPEMDGFQVCKELKSNPKTKHIPIIMISVKNNETDVCIGLEMGAEDYISKPFRKRELMARVKTVFRRYEIDPREQKIEAGPFLIDYGKYEAKVNGKAVTLTPKEFELFGFLVRREGRVVTRAAISENVWGVEFTNSTRTIDVHIDQLRKKIGKMAPCIKSLKGVGYRFELEK